jgi:hypothetical protein
MKRCRTTLALCAMATGACSDRIIETVALGGGTDTIACSTPYATPLAETSLGEIDRSHWLQPWRAYSETWAAERMRRAVGGIMPNVTTDLTVQRTLANELARIGFFRVGTEWAWDGVDDVDPGTWTASFNVAVQAQLDILAKAGLRPKILVNGDEGIPCPVHNLKLKTVSAASGGDRRVQLDTASLSQVVRGRTGFNRLDKKLSAEVLIVDYTSDGWATLSKPLPADLAVGDHDASTLHYEPFRRPKQADQTASPAFEATMAGFISYIDLVVRTAKAKLGKGEFDIELWNEFPIKSAFLDINSYYDPPIETGSVDDTIQEIRNRTAARLRDATLDAGDVGLVDGFSNTRWSDPHDLAGFSAFSRHVRFRAFRFPGDSVVPIAASLYPAAASRSLDAFGGLNGATGPDGWQEAFTPAYTAYFPELPLTGILPPSVGRDLSNIPTSNSSGGTFGRAIGKPDVWVSALSFDNGWPGSVGIALDDADARRMTAKALLRALVAYVGQGAAAVFPYFGPGSADHLLDASGAIDAPLEATRRLLGAFAGPAVGLPRQIDLLSIISCDSGLQFQGDGTPARPDLRNADVVAFYPFQADDKRFVVGTYVMTRDVTPLGAATSPEEHYRLTIDHVDPKSSVTLYDPLSDGAASAEIVSRHSTGITVDTVLSDSPRLLVIQEP